LQEREVNCYFLRCRQEDVYHVATSLKAVTIRFTEEGKEVLTLEKATLGHFLVVKGQPKAMLNFLFESIGRGPQEGLCTVL